MITIENLVKDYGTFRAVNGISFSVAAGEIMGFLGVNGAGKTTTLKMLAGILRPTSGKIELGGINLLQNPQGAKRIVGYIPDRPYLYAKLTAKEFLLFVADLYDIPRKVSRGKIKDLLNEYGLTEWQHELIDSFSHGMKQRLATCSALIHDPKILIVDEPMVGLDPHGAKLLKDKFREYASRGVALILSTHSLNVAEEVADRITIIERGSIITSGTVDQIRSQHGAQNESLEDMFLKLTSNVYPS